MAQIIYGFGVCCVIAAYSLLIIKVVIRLGWDLALTNPNSIFNIFILAVFMTMMTEIGLGRLLEKRIG